MKISGKYTRTSVDRIKLKVLLHAYIIKYNEYNLIMYIRTYAFRTESDIPIVFLVINGTTDLIFVHPIKIVFNDTVGLKIYQE